MIHKLFFAITLAFLSVLPVQEKRTEQGSTYLVRNPDAVILELLPPKPLSDIDQTSSGPYEQNARVYFRLLATNSSLEPISVPIINDYFQSRPELIKDGDVLKYKTGVREVLRNQEDEIPRGLVQVVKLEPNEQRLIGYVYLDKWYGQLLPGHYELSVKHRFEPGQKWVQSQAITFEVTPAKPSTPKG